MVGARIYIAPTKCWDGMKIWGCLVLQTHCFIHFLQLDLRTSMPVTFCLAFSVSRWAHPGKSVFDLFRTMSISFIFMFAFLQGAISLCLVGAVLISPWISLKWATLCPKILGWPAVLQHNKPEHFYDTNVPENPIYLPLHLRNGTPQFCNIHTVVVVSSFGFVFFPHFPCLQKQNAPAALSGPFSQWGNSSYKAILLDCHLHSMNTAFKTTQGIYLLFHRKRKKTTPNWTESSDLWQDCNKREEEEVRKGVNLEIWTRFGASVFKCSGHQTDGATHIEERRTQER